MPRGVRLNPEHDDRTRAKIQTSQIVNRLQSFIKGSVKMEPAQVTAALGLLRKTLPDLSQTDVTRTVKQDVRDYTREELKAIIANETGSRDRRAAPSGSAIEPDSVH